VQPIVAGDGRLLLPRGHPALSAGWIPATLDLETSRLVEWPDKPLELTVTPAILNPEEVLDAIARAYPNTLRREGRGGTVGMLFLVGASGAVEGIRVGQIAAYEELNAAAVQVARVYRFSPAQAGGEPVAVWVSHAIDFRVE